MRIGTQALEGRAGLQDTAFGEGVQVVLAASRIAESQREQHQRVSRVMAKLQELEEDRNNS